ncbi:glycoside hydrolase family 16 protein [Mycena metata]|uniref:Glycoside hydrolase family 16 protein n=1 Tax=Mycena metata TaxID=1033252 RepID=A0AAD7NB77_9AGAR|nr:glycoside hydrolase family 16 protein [Mycena metata]
MSYPQQPPYSYHENPSEYPFAASQNSVGFAPSEDGSQYNLTIKPEPEDFSHHPRAEKKGVFARHKGIKIGGLLALLLIVVAAVAYPLARHFMNSRKTSTNASANSALNANLPNISSWSLVDAATPKDAYTIPSYHDPSKSMQLVFSDEFETDGRTFYPGDDPSWEAVDLHYWQTGDLEYYDPSAVTTKNGALEITLSKVDDISTNHGFSYRSAMVSSWNKLCFTGGILVSSVTLPGTTNIFGLWPAVWAMGNLGRAGYGASVDGLWPYSYDTCDVGTLSNQTLPGNSGPQAALTSGPQNTELSFLPGQRLSACTCAGEAHPGPKKSDGSLVGRSAPEIDVFEATLGGSASGLIGQVSQSAQWAPFDAGYASFNSTDNLVIPDTSISSENAFVGNKFQQTTSVLTNTNQDCYQLKGGCFSTYGFEYKPGYADGYISWITDNKLAWTLNGNMVGADTATQIGARQVPVEPMYIIMNLGLSQSFGYIDFDNLTFPAVMRVDWVRVYQDPTDAQSSVGCSPTDFPTADYINQYQEAYTNPNLTTWVDDFHQVIPKNRLADTC